MLFGINLLPQEDRFYDLLSEVGELAYQSVQLLNELVVEEDEDKRYKLGRDIQEAKARAKKVAHEVSAMLCRTFITPFDREDIHELVFGLYKIPKVIEKVQTHLLHFQLKPYQNDFYKLSCNISEAAETLQYLMQNLKHLKDSQLVHDKSELLSNVETRQDELIMTLLVELYQSDMDAKEVILRKDIYDLMEHIMDRHRDMGNVVQQIVLKHT